MFHIVLFEPEIPPNTGNIIRLCANTGSQLHLIHPLGFTLSDKQLRRAGLDYREWATVKEHADFLSFQKNVAFNRLFACTTKANQLYSTVTFLPQDAFLFGPETRGLPLEIVQLFPPSQQLRIPMQPQSRSLNLSNAATVILYEAWRQHQFSGNK